MSMVKFLIAVGFSLILGMLATLVTMFAVIHHFPATLFTVVFIILSYMGHTKIEKLFLFERNKRARQTGMGILYVLSTLQLWQLYAGFAGLIHNPVLFASHAELLFLLTGVFEGFVIWMFVYLRMNKKNSKFWFSIATHFVSLTIFLFILVTLSMDRLWLKNVVGVQF